MAATILGNGNIQFGDGTTLSSANIPLTSVVNVPTQLSQFSNDLGNYGTWLTAANIDPTPNSYSWPYNGNNVNYGMYLGLAWNNTTKKAAVAPTWANCFCNC